MDTASLWVGNKEVASVFHLLGESEDSISLAIAWSLASNPRFRQEFLRRLVGKCPARSAATVRVHRYEASGGTTDIEIYDEQGSFHIVIEAKRGWVLPGLRQLKKYAKRRTFSEQKAKARRLVALSECSNHYAKIKLGAAAIDGVPVIAVSWKDLVSYARAAARGASRSEKRCLSELIDYLGVVMMSQRKDTNEVYVVSLGRTAPKGWKTSWIDIVRKHRRYFHPIGPRWPREPLTYVGFRYSGKLQSIHYVEKYEVIHNLRRACPGIPDTPVEPHYLYVLGKPILPNHDVRNGNLWPNGRVWCALDTLLTSKTVFQARDITQKRRNRV